MLSECELSYPILTEAHKRAFKMNEKLCGRVGVLNAAVVELRF